MSALNEIASIKQRLNYASSWVSIFGMPILIINLLQDKLNVIGIQIHFLILLFGSISLLVLFGYIAEKFGLIKAEANWGWKQQEQMRKDVIK
jgi:predicted permease